MIEEVTLRELDPDRFIEQLAAEILREVPSVVSVTYNIATKPPSTIEAV